MILSMNDNESEARAEAIAIVDATGLWYPVLFPISGQIKRQSHQQHRKFLEWHTME